MEGGVSHIYQGYNNYIVPIQRQIEGYRRKYQPPTHKLAIPVATVNLAYKIGKKIKDAAAETALQLCIIAFYFLLRIGECTLTMVTKQGNCATRTVQFWFGDIGFLRNGSIHTTTTISTRPPLES